MRTARDMFPGAPDPDSNPNEWVDTEATLAVHVMRRDRLNHPNMSVPRIVKGLARLDYVITVAEYKDLERYPYNNLHLVREGIVSLVYRVLRGDLPAYTNSDKYTQAVMAEIKAVREARGYKYADMAKGVSALGDQVTEDQYRTMEQGITKDVSVSLVIRAALALEISPVQLFSDMEN